MHVNKQGEHSILQHVEIMECKYFRVSRSNYYFYIAIEAIEEGYPGAYVAEVAWNLSNGARSLCKFVLTDYKPFGTLGSFRQNSVKTRSKGTDVVGICGEHGGETSLAFFDGAGLNYVSCSPFSTNDEYTQVGICGEHGGEPSSVAFLMGVPIVRLTAAQVAVQAS
ncbi:40S ribosomal protein S13 [Tanacetum coccineum]